MFEWLISILTCSQKIKVLKKKKTFGKEYHWSYLNKLCPKAPCSEADLRSGIFLHFHTGFGEINLELPPPFGVGAPVLEILNPLLVLMCSFPFSDI